MNEYKELPADIILEYLPEMEDTMTSLEDLEESYTEYCSVCGAGLVEGAVAECLGDTSQCGAYNYHEEMLDYAPEKELDFSDKPRYWEAEPEDDDEEDYT